MPRRYQIGIKPTYDDKFDMLKMSSGVLNATNFRAMPSAHSVNINDKAGCESLLVVLKGNQDGQYYRPEARDFQQAALPEVLEELKEFDAQFKTYQQQQVNLGRAQPTDWPEHLLNSKLELQAAEDVINEEISFLEGRLKKLFDEPEKKSNDKLVLVRGTEGAAVIQGGIINEVDGQRVSLIKNTLCIDDSRSKYDGLATSVYFEKIVLPWLKERTLLQRRLVLEAKKDKKKRKLNAMPKLLPWPTGAKNHKEIK